VAPAISIPVADDAADIVVAAWMLYHVPDLDAVLREVRRVLRPGGTLVAVTNGAAHLAALPGQFRPRPGGRSADLRRAT
jgi:ubiquinone/menaquinone biosynthesis C-methylase UbiE